MTPVYGNTKRFKAYVDLVTVRLSTTELLAIWVATSLETLEIWDQQVNLYRGKKTISLTTSSDYC